MALDPILAQALKDKNMISNEAYQKFVPSPVMTNEAGIAAALDMPEPDVAQSNPLVRAHDAIASVVSPAIDAARNTASSVANSQVTAGANKALGGNTPATSAAVDPNVPEKAVELPPLVVPKTQASSGGSSMGSGYGTTMSGLNQQKVANDDAAKAGIAEANAQAAFQQQTYDNAEKMRLSEEAKQMDRQKILDEKMALVNEKQAAYAAKPVTVGDKFAEASTGQKIQMAIGLFLGAAPNSTGQNKALATLQASIDSDLAKAKTDISNATNIYNDMKETFKDKTQAEAAARITYLNNAQLKVNQIASQFSGPKIAAAAKQLNGKIDEEKGAAMATFAKSVNLQSNLTGADDVTAQILKLPANLQGPALEAKEVYDATNAAFKAFDQSFKLGDELGLNSKIPFSEAQTQLAVENAKIESAVRATMKGQGTIQEAEIKRLIEPFQMAATDTAGRRKIKLAGLKNLLATKNAGQINRLKNFGFLPQAPTDKYKMGAPVKSGGK
jgi:hypothetical protein